MRVKRHCLQYQHRSRYVGHKSLIYYYYSKLTSRKPTLYPTREPSARLTQKPTCKPTAVLDLLTETLEDRIETWQTSCKRNLFRRNKSLVSIARGMQYSHQQGIIFRDLKPQNVGFSPNGQVKIFDLGIARDVQQCLATNQKLGFAGTPRYMAPEVGNGEIYDRSADIYSFGILLWEICTLQKPFSKMRTLGGTRDKATSQQDQTGWSQGPHHRMLV